MLSEKVEAAYCCAWEAMFVEDDADAELVQDIFEVWRFGR